jgi:CPA1 family monovalent cation:H+ antiporter
MLAFIAQWIAWKTRLPGILLLLLFGVALGQFIRPDDLLAALSGGSSSVAGPRILFPIVSLAVAIIMFEGGLSLKLSELKEAGDAVFRLCTIGALLTWGGSGLAAYYLLGFDWRLSCLLGAIMIVTGPTVIGPLLRQVQPSSRVANTLKWEGILIDPIGAVAAVLVFDVLMIDAAGSELGHGIWLLGKTVLVGVAGGVAFGAAVSFALRRFLLPDHLHGVVSLASVLILFAVCDAAAHESGLIAVTIFGLWMTNQNGLDIEHIIEFKENLTTLLIGCLFILLASRIELSTLAEVAWPGLWFVLALIVVVRPLSVFLSLPRSGLEFREQVFVAALAPRGIVAAAVSSVFALRMEQTVGVDIPGAGTLTSITFMAIIATVSVYGLLASPIAKALDLSDPNRNGLLIAGADDWVIAFAKEVKQAGCRVLLIDTNYRKVTKAKLAELEAVCANVMNEHLFERLSLAGIGRFLAMTENDQVNSLAVRECRTLFGRPHTYQLTFKTDTVRGMTRNMMGRELFSRELTFDQIADLFEHGLAFKTTGLSEEFSYADFLNEYEAVHVLAVLNERGELSIVTSEMTPEPAAGHTVIALVDGGTKRPETAGEEY